MWRNNLKLTYRRVQIRKSTWYPTRPVKYRERGICVYDLCIYVRTYVCVYDTILKRTFKQRTHLYEGHKEVINQKKIQ